MAENGGGKGALSYPLAAVLTIVGMVITGLTTFYGVRDQAIAACRNEVQTIATQLRQERHEELRHYVSREDWATWKEANRARSDAQYFELMTAIQRIGVKLAR